MTRPPGFPGESARREKGGQATSASPPLWRPEKPGSARAIPVLLDITWVNAAPRSLPSRVRYNQCAYAGAATHDIPNSQTRTSADRVGNTSGLPSGKDIRPPLVAPPGRDRQLFVPLTRLPQAVRAWQLAGRRRRCHVDRGSARICCHTEDRDTQMDNQEFVISDRTIADFLACPYKAYLRIINHTPRPSKFMELRKRCAAPTCPRAA